LQATYSSRDQITAFYLAQEANEYIRNTRDTNTLSETNEWNAYLTDCLATTCTVDTSKTPEEGGLEPCVGECKHLRYDATSNQYGYTPVLESQFKRYITLEQPGANINELRVTTNVEWKAGVRERAIVVESLIFNWE
jgi:hypothetical protein